MTASDLPATMLTGSDFDPTPDTDGKPVRFIPAPDDAEMDAPDVTPPPAREVRRYRLVNASDMPEDRLGCSRRCSEQHTYLWGQCELAVDPGPVPLLVSETFTANDGWLSTSIPPATAEELAAHPSVIALMDAAKPAEPADEDEASPPMIGYATASDRALVARATGGGIRSAELLPDYADDEEGDPHYAAARAYCLVRFEYPAGFYADQQAREQHVEMDTRSQAQEPPFRAAVDRAVELTKQRLDRSEDHLVAQLTAALMDARTALAAATARADKAEAERDRYRSDVALVADQLVDHTVRAEHEWCRDSHPLNLCPELDAAGAAALRLAAMVATAAAGDVPEASAPASTSPGQPGTPRGSR